MKGGRLWIIPWLCLISLGFPWGVGAAQVGRFIQVEGEVDLLKAGKLPTLPVKVEDPVQPGDVIRTKSGSRAQVKFIDDSLITIAPGSRVAIEEYLYDEAKGQRRAVVQVFRGLVETVVNKILQREEPDFIMKTHTALLGVRGTHWYTLLRPTVTEVYTANTKLGVKNLFAEIPGEVILGARMATFVGQNLPPTVPLPITQDVLNNLKQLTVHGVKVKEQVTTNTVKQLPSAIAAVAAEVKPRPALAQIYLPPPVLSPNNFITLNFTQTWTGTWTSTASGLVRTVNGGGAGSGSFPGLFNGIFNMVNNATAGGFQPSDSGTFTITTTGQAKGIKGQPLNGTMQIHFSMTGVDAMSGNLAGSIKTFPGGKVTGNLAGTHPFGAYQSHTTMSLTQTRR
jgi:hypothetical protein